MEQDLQVRNVVQVQINVRKVLVAVLLVMLMGTWGTTMAMSSCIWNPRPPKYADSGKFFSSFSSAVYASSTDFSSPS